MKLTGHRLSQLTARPIWLLFDLPPSSLLAPLAFSSSSVCYGPNERVLLIKAGGEDKLMRGLVEEWDGSTGAANSSNVSGTQKDRWDLQVRTTDHTDHALPVTACISLQGKIGSLKNPNSQDEIQRLYINSLLRTKQKCSR